MSPLDASRSDLVTFPKQHLIPTSTAIMEENSQHHQFAQALQEAMQNLQTVLDDVRKDKEDVQNEREQLRLIQSDLKALCDDLRKEKQGLAQDRKELQRLQSQQEMLCDDLRKQKESVQQDREQLAKDRLQLDAALEEHQTERRQLEAQRSAFVKEKTSHDEQVKATKEEFDAERQQFLTVKDNQGQETSQQTQTSLDAQRSLTKAVSDLPSSQTITHANLQAGTPPDPTDAPAVPTLPESWQSSHSMNRPDERPRTLPEEDGSAKHSLPWRWQSKDMLDAYLRHQWPSKTHLVLRPSGLDCLVVVMRHVVSYLPQQPRDFALKLSKDEDKLTKLFWTMVWTDYDRAGSQKADALRSQFLDYYCPLTKQPGNKNPSFHSLCTSDEAFMARFWDQEELKTLALCLLRLQGVWHENPQRQLGLVWPGSEPLQDFIGGTGGFRATAGFEMLTVFGAPETLVVHYKAEAKGRLPDFYNEIRGFNLMLSDFNEEGVYAEQQEISYRLIAVVRHRGPHDEHDSVRLYRPNGILVGSSTATDYYPTTWTVSDSEKYTLIYARFELPDMHQFVAYPELPTVADLQHQQTRNQKRATKIPADEPAAQSASHVAAEPKALGLLDQQHGHGDASRATAGTPTATTARSGTTTSGGYHPFDPKKTMMNMRKSVMKGRPSNQRHNPGQETGSYTFHPGQSAESSPGRRRPFAQHSESVVSHSHPSAVNEAVGSSSPLPSAGRTKNLVSHMPAPSEHAAAADAEARCKACNQGTHHTKYCWYLFPDRARDGNPRWKPIREVEERVKRNVENDPDIQRLIRQHNTWEEGQSNNPNNIPIIPRGSNK